MVGAEPAHPLVRAFVVALRDLGYEPGTSAPASGFAIQARVNMETMRPDGATVPSGGEIAVFEPATGPGIRVDTFGYAGYTTSPRYDSLLAKLIVHTPSPSFHDALARTYRALCEFRIEGLALPGNPRSSAITAMSVVREILGGVSPILI